MATPTLKVFAAFGVNPLAANPSNPAQWTDISSFLISDGGYSSRRGRNNEFDQVQAGTATLVLNNTDRRFETGYAGSPYYPNVIAGVPIRIIAEWNGIEYPRFRGYAQAWTPQIDGLHNKVVLSVADAIGAYFSRVIIGEEVAITSTVGETGNQAGLIGTHPGNRKVVFRVPGLSAGQSVSLFLSGTNGGGVPVSETLTVSYPTLIAISTNNYRHLSTVNISSTSGSPSSMLEWTLTIDPTWPRQAVGYYMRDMLHAIRWFDTPGNGSAGGGNSIAQSATINSNLLATLSMLNEVENGVFYISNSGAFVFVNRHALNTGSANIVVTNQPSGAPGTIELVYDQISIDYSAQYVFNDIKITRANSNAIGSARDIASQQKYFLRSFSKSNLLIDTDAELSDAAYWHLYYNKEQKPRIDSVRLRGNMWTNEDQAWQNLLSSDLTRKVIVRHHPPGGGAPIEQICTIEQINDSFKNGDFTITWRLSPSRVGNFLIMDDAEYGRVDYNAVAY